MGAYIYNNYSGFTIVGCQVFAQRTELCGLRLLSTFSLTRPALKMYLVWSARNSFPKVLLTAYESHVDAVTPRPE
jgi:hypothetical protein